MGEDVTNMLETAIAFVSLDRVGSGVLSSEHFRYLRELCTIKSDMFAEMKSLDEVMPLDPYGTIRLCQWVLKAATWVTVRNRVLFDQQLTRMFNKYDEDGSGSIEEGEFASVIFEMLTKTVMPQNESQEPTVRSIAEDVASELLTDMDDDGSRSIDYEEFKTAVRIIQKKHKAIKHAMKTASTLYSVQEALKSR